MAANIKIQNVLGVPVGNVEISDPINLAITLLNVGEEGDAYLNVYCDASWYADPGYSKGLRLKNWRPAGEYETMVFVGTRWLTDEYADPNIAPLGLCAGCHPDGDCWRLNPFSDFTLTFEAGYLDEDNIAHPTDVKQMPTFGVGGGAVSTYWPYLAIGLGGVGLYLLAKKK